MIKNIPRDILYHQHQLSHQQIDDLLGENESRNYAATKAQHLGKLAEFESLIKLFSDNNISFVPLKGPLLSQKLYDDPLYRSYNDLDFLIDFCQIERITGLLLSRGYHCAFYRFPASECKKKILYNHYNELAMLSEKTDTAVELHWSLLFPEPVKQGLMNKIVNENITVTEFKGFLVKTLSNELELLYVVVHGGLHGWYKLKWLVDVHEFLRVYKVDEKTFMSLVKTLRAEMLVATCNELLSVYFPGSPTLPQCGKAPVKIVAYCRSLIDKDESHKKNISEYLAEFMHSMRSFPGIRYKVRLVRSLLFASDLASVRWIPCWSPVYYIISPFWKLWRGFR